MNTEQLAVYVITDPELGRGRGHVEQAREALAGGATAIQLRDKAASDADLLPIARELRALTRAMGALFIVNDRVELALAVGADGAHVGQEDMSAGLARATLGPDAILGVSAATVEEVRQAEAAGADYIGCGAVFSTASKADAGEAIGPWGLAELRAVTHLPIVAIGGLTAANVGAAIRAGADGAAVISAIVSQPDIAAAARELALAVRSARGEAANRVAKALTIAGSDSGGGAGIQADLKTFSALGVYGSSVVTAITAQNTRGVTAVHDIPLDIVQAQADAVMSDIGADAAKTGMLASPEIIEVVAGAVERWALRRLVVDPVMVAKSGDRLLRADAIETLRRRLLPLALVVTPNVPEAEVLAGFPVRDEADAREAARAIHALGVRHVIVKGGHFEGEPVSVDTLFDGERFLRFESRRVPTQNTHGTGCSFSAAIAAYLAQGYAVDGAVALAKRFITDAIEAAYPIGAGHSPIHHFHQWWP